MGVIGDLDAAVLDNHAAGVAGISRVVFSGCGLSGVNLEGEVFVGDVVDGEFGIGADG